MMRLCHYRFCRLASCAAAWTWLVVAVLPAARAAVLTAGDVTPTDNLLTDVFITGNGQVIGFEGIQEFQPFDNDPFSPPAFSLIQYTFETPEDIEVGKNSWGEVEINGGSEVRYQHLVIGGSAADAGFSLSLDELNDRDPGVFGRVVVRDRGSLFNNNPAIGNAAFPGITDPTARPTDAGFDVFVGLTGTGQLSIENRARMEIQDALMVGFAPHAVGFVNVEGLGSHIDQRGDPGQELDPPFRQSSLSQTLIGPLGSGELDITAGGSVRSGQGATLGTINSRGGRTATGLQEPGSILSQPFTGGFGSARVDGTGSAWRIANGLAIGTFMEDPQLYLPNDGSGELTVSNGGLVSVFSTEDDSSILTEGNILVGVFGRVQLDNGRIVTTDDLLNDGLIAGSGRIDTAHFLNRGDGRLSVGTGQQLRISSDAATFAPDLAGGFFFANDGLIEVFGGELEFQRLAAGPNDLFLNRFVPPFEEAPARRGVIQAKNGTLRFHSGISNEGLIAFTEGSNLVQGDVFNEIGGDIVLSGAASVVFQDNLVNAGLLDLGLDGTITSMAVLGDFNSLPSAALNMNLNLGPNNSEFNHVAVTGDVILGGGLHVDLVSPFTFSDGDEFELISSTGTLAGNFSALDLPTLPANLFWMPLVSDNDFILRVMEIASPLVGADFNGDGVVDHLDLAIWEANFGITMGATPALGDANGDGAVDVDDYFLWLAQNGGPPSGALVAGASAVPEPSTVLLAFVGLAVAGWTRRR